MQHVIGSIALVIMVAFGFAVVHDACDWGLVTRPASRPKRDNGQPMPGCDRAWLTMLALSETESGGNYGITQRRTGALGRYQVMPANVPRWSKKILGVEATTEQFLASSAVQDAVVYGIINDAWKRFGNFKDVASEWHSGDPFAEAIARNATDGDMKTVDYVAKTERSFTVLMGQCSASGSDWACPADQTLVTSKFGPRWGKTHEGVDIEGDKGNRNYAVLPGKVDAARWLGDSCGLGVQVDHGNGLKTLHCHNASLLVETGDAVSKGQAVGMTGTTGHSTGIHTHFEVMVNGREIDPQAMLPARCVSGPKARTLLARN